MTPFMLELICAVVDDHPQGSQEPPKAQLYPIGTKVKSTMEGRATGRIVGYNTNPPQAIYSAERYPYVIKWADGYQDYYCLYPGLIEIDEPANRLKKIEKKMRRQS